MTPFSAGTLFDDGPTGKIDIEQMKLLVALNNVPLLSDPQESILELAVGCRLMYANVYGDATFTSFFSDAPYKFAVVHRLD